MVRKGNERILIVDDNPNVRSSLSAVLADEEFDVSAVADGEEAFEFLKTNTPSVMLLDIWLPGLGGMEVLKEVGQTHPETTVIMISGHGTIELAVQAMKLGAYGFIEKPLSLENVLQQVHHALQSRRQTLEIKELRQRVGRSHELIGLSSAMESIRTVSYTHLRAHET